MGMVAGDAAQQAQASAANPQQRVLRETSASFATHAEEAGWSDGESMSGAALRAFNVLIHGRASADAGETADPAAAFIEARAYEVADPVDVAASLAAEIREARVGVRAVNAASAAVLMGPARPAWSRREDVRAAEVVVEKARHARTLFRDVSIDVAPRLDASARELIDGELAEFDVELHRLSLAADALGSAEPDVELREVDTIAPELSVG